MGRDAGQIADEVISHLSGLVGSEVRVTLEIDAEIPDGAPENVVRTVTENSRTLKFASHGFEESCAKFPCTGASGQVIPEKMEQGWRKEVARFT